MKTRSTPRAPRHRWTVLLICAVTTGSAAAISAVGCEQRPPLTPTSGEGGSDDTATTSSTSTATEDKARQLFEAIEDDMMSACGSCHDAGGFADTPFLRQPRYESITSWPDIVKKDPADSILLTHAVSGGGHGGTNLDSASLKNTLLPKVQEWLAEEAKAIADVPEEQKGKSVEPFAPILGFNAVYLTDIDEAFTGMAVTFTANELTPTSLELTNIEVHTTAKLGIHLVHPLFSVYPKGGQPDPDPADSFSNLDQYVDYGQSAPLGPGTLILTNWLPDGKLGLSFENVEPFTTMLPDGGTDGGLTGGCKDVALFDSTAKNSFTPCLSCHQGNDSQAKAAVDMTGLVNDQDVANACAQIRNRVNPNNPGQSQIFITTDPGGAAAHPFKFGQNAGNWNGFKNAVTPWIEGEK